MKPTQTVTRARRGFAAMKPALQRELAQKGGKAVSRGSKGSAYMATLGAKGGLKTQANIRALQRGNKQ